ncbi:unnamed protein product, partial [Phaeothamnion confervicola]
WAGAVFLVAAYSRALNETEVWLNYLAGLPDSLPVVSAVSVKISEDGEVGDHYDDPAFYLNVVPFDSLTGISLDVSDMEDTEGWPSNEEGWTETDEAPTVYVASKPAAGTLYDSSGAAVATVPHALPAPEAGTAVDGKFNFTVRYRPPKDEYSATATTVFANFKYYAVDARTGKQSAENATVSVYVTAKNDPPVAAN